ncbi:MAG TPA: hypothetical protein VH583_14460 [Vicinamibacterales bacterium]|jgi:hypothetical protein
MGFGLSQHTFLPFAVSELVTATFLIGLGCSPLTVAADSDPDGATIIARSMKASEADWAAARFYAYDERVHDDDGTRTYEVLDLLGTPYKRVTTVNGAPVSGDQKEKEDQKLSHEREKRESESAEERSQRVRDYENSREQAHRIILAMPHAFDYRLAGKRQLSTGTVYIVEATPNKAYDPPNAEAEVLSAMTGEFWIDTRTYQWIHGVAHVRHPVTIHGFLATVEPGTEFELDQMYVGDNVWLPKHFEIRSQASVLYLFHHHTFEEHTFFNYTKPPDGVNLAPVQRS